MLRYDDIEITKTKTAQGSLEMQRKLPWQHTSSSTGHTVTPDVTWISQ